MTTPVTEADFRLPEFKDARYTDYEKLEDGTIVRRDRHVLAVTAIADLLGTQDPTEVVTLVEELITRFGECNRVAIDHSNKMGELMIANDELCESNIALQSNLEEVTDKYHEAVKVRLELRALYAERVKSGRDSLNGLVISPATHLVIDDEHVNFKPCK